MPKTKKVNVPKPTKLTLPIINVDPKDITGKPRKLKMVWSLFNTVDIFRDENICEKCDEKQFCDIERMPPQKVNENCKFITEHAVSQKIPAGVGVGVKRKKP